MTEGLSCPRGTNLYNPPASLRSAPSRIGLPQKDAVFLWDFHREGKGRERPSPVIPRNEMTRNPLAFCLLRGDPSHTSARAVWRAHLWFGMTRWRGMTGKKHIPKR